MMAVEEAHLAELDSLKETRQKEVMQIHMQCAADTAKQVRTF